METIGDSASVSEETPSNVETVEFERNLDNFKKTLDTEEHRLKELEQQRVKLQEEVELMFTEITAEKEKYREAIDDVIEEHEKVSKYFLQSCKVLNEVSPVGSSTTLFEDCASSVEAVKNLDYNIHVDLEDEIEKIRRQLIDNIPTKEDYLATVKEHFLQKEMNLELTSETENSEDVS